MTPFIAEINIIKLSFGSYNSPFSYPGKISKLRIIFEIQVFISNIANFCPIQFLGPALNGTNAYGLLSRTFSGKNRSGSYFSGSGYIAGFLCTAAAKVDKVIFFGRTKPPKI